MNILYVAKHGNHDNCDEDAIGWCLEQLGHHVTRIGESEQLSNVSKHELLLFHKWQRTDLIRRLPVRKACWYFDLLTSYCPTLRARMAQRRAWMAAVLPHATVFCTDGDFGRGTVHLMQGFDERQALYYAEPPRGVMFAGTVAHGQQRVECVQALKRRYGSLFRVLEQPRLHGRELAESFPSVVVAPDGPISDRYWSNRVYLTLGLGGFLLHPHCSMLREHYDEGELAMYSSRRELFDMVDRALEDGKWREALRVAGHRRTLATNTYRHRVGDMLAWLTRSSMSLTGAED